MGIRNRKMWHWLIDYIPETSLDRWAWIMALGTILLPISGAICGWIRLEISDKVSKNKEMIEVTRVSRLQAAEDELAKTKAELIKRMAEAEAVVRPKPLRVRLRDVLSSIDSKILPALRAGTRNFNGGITASQFHDLQKIAGEAGAKEFIAVDPDVKMGVGMGPEGITYGVKFSVDPKLLDDENFTSPKSP